MPVPIKQTLDRIPGGLMLVPLFLGATIVTLWPGAPQFFGSFTGAMLTVPLPLLAMFYVCMGATIEIRTTPYILRKGGALFAAKLLTGLAAGVVAGRVLGASPLPSGAFAGLSTLAIVAAINDTNGGLYMALMGQFGRTRDAAAYAIMSIESGAFLTMVTLGAAGLSAFPWPTLVGAVLPLCLGVLLGALDPDVRRYLAPACPILIPFFALAIGGGINLANVWRAGLLGIVLGLAVVVVSGAVLFVADRLTGGDGIAGLAAASTAGNAAAVPALVASANPAYAPAAPQATVLVAASIVVTAGIVPLLTMWWARRLGVTGGPSAEAEPPR